MPKPEVRDLRVKEKFFLDDAYLNGYAKKCGWKATLVYLSLCRHADKQQQAFPSVQLMAQEHNVSVNTIRRGIKDLEQWNIIQVIRTFDDTTKKYLNNIYYLLDKSEWKYIKNQGQRPVRAVEKKKPAPPGDRASALWGKNQRPVVTHKDTHIKDTHIRKENNKTFKESKVGSRTGRHAEDIVYDEKDRTGKMEGLRKDLQDRGLIRKD